MTLWQVLLLGLVWIVLAGVAGSFIGKAIAKLSGEYPDDD